MNRPQRAYLTALPLSALPELRELLAPFLGEAKRRGHVVMMRLGDEPVERLDQLVEAGLFGSRSEAAAFLVGAGIRAQRVLFDRIARDTAHLKRVRASLRRTALEALRGEASAGRTRRKS